MEKFRKYFLGTTDFPRCLLSHPLFSEVGSESPKAGSGGGVAHRMVSSELLRREQRLGRGQSPGPPARLGTKATPGAVAGHSSPPRCHVGNTWSYAPRGSLLLLRTLELPAGNLLHPRPQPGDRRSPGHCKALHASGMGRGTGCLFHTDPASQMKLLATLDP